MRILLVHYRYYHSAGPERYMFNIKRALEERGHEVIPFSVRSGKNEKTEYEKYFVPAIDGGDGFYYGSIKKTPRTVLRLLSRSIYSPEVKRALQKEIRDTKPDLVYVLHFVNKLSPSVIRGAKQMGLPVVVRLSDYFLLCPRFDFLRGKRICEDCLTKGYRCCIKNRCVKGSLFASAVRVLAMKIHAAMGVYDDVDAFVTPSRFLRDELARNGFSENRLHWIPTFSTGPRSVDNVPVGSYGLYFGRIAAEKGVDAVVRAYERMPERQVLFVGDDATEDAVRLKQYVAARGLKNITFAGFRQGDELEDAIRSARFVLVPSIWYDNLPNTALEAFRNAKPVIASDIGSLTELVTDGENGYLFQPGNVDELVERIERLDDDELVKRMGAKCLELSKDRFSEQRHCDELLSVFDEAIRETARL